MQPDQLTVVVAGRLGLGPPNVFFKKILIDQRIQCIMLFKVSLALVLPKKTFDDFSKSMSPEERAV